MNKIKKRLAGIKKACSRYLSLLLAVAMLVGMLPADAIAAEATGTKVDVVDNVIDITDKTVGSISKYYATAIGVQIDGAVVSQAYEDGTTIYVVLGSDTAEDAVINITFTTSLNKMTMEGTAGSVTLSGGMGELSQTLTAKYSSSKRGTATYTLVFFKDEPPTQPPVCVKDTDSHEMYKNTNWDISLNNYFEAATIYYLVNGDEKIQLEKNVYSFMPATMGTHTLVFAAANEVGECENTVTISVNVKEITSGAWIGYETGNGSIKYVLFSDSDGNEIEGIVASYADNVIDVVLPKNYNPKGKIIAKFTRTANSSDLPFVTPSNSASGSSSASGKKTDTYTTTLSGGSASQKVYVYDSTPKATSNKYVTWTINYSMINEAPVLVDGANTPKTATITVGDNYELNLAPLFSDADGDALTYQYQVNSGEWKNCDADFTYSNEMSGNYVLNFRAYDEKNYSDENYVVNLTIEDMKETYAVKVNVPEGIAPVFYSSNAEGVLGSELEATERNGVYTVNVPGNVQYIAWRADGMGMSAPVNKDAELELVKSVFKVMAGEAEDTGASVKVTLDNLEIVGNGMTYLLLKTDGYTYTATPSGSNYDAGTFKNRTPQNGEIELELEQKHFTVIAPIGSVVSAGVLNGAYGYSFSKALSVEAVEDTVVYKFAPLSGNAFIRVQRPDDPDAVTYWDFKSAKTVDKTITVTEKMLFMNDSETSDFNANTVYHNFEQYFLDVGDIYLNINAKGYINLEKGKTKTLNAFRNWQATESFLNSKIALPDFDYEIITLEGKDVITIEKNADNSAVATLRAENEGTAIVLVTYDAMYSELTAASAGGSQGGANRFSAIWPERTGVFVVSVGKEESEIKTNMTCNGGTFDAEHSPQFYTGEDGASVSFKPEANCTVTVNRSTVGAETLSFGEFTDEGVSVAADGTVTVSGLTTGRHILKIEKGGVASYQVVTAQQVTCEITDAEGKVLNDNDVINAGEVVTVTLKGLTNPAEKLATAYNFNAQLTYFDEEGNSYQNSTGTTLGQYNFSSSPQEVEVTIPADWSQETFTLNGYITMGGYSGKEIGGHRTLTYTGSGMAQGSTPIGLNLGTLPEITINVKPAPVPATGITLDKNEIELRATESVTLKGVVTPENATDKVLWISSDESVAVVENGVVTAKAAGNATIIVSAGEYQAKCVVTVKDAIPVEQLVLNKTEAELELGKMLTLKATIAPENATNKTITWKSSDESVATVSPSGVVIAKGEGTVSISAIGDGVETTCIITVKRKADTDNKATVYLSISHDDEFLKSNQTGTVMAMQKLEVPYFDLAQYGLERYTIPQGSADYGKVTALHLYIYAMEVCNYGVAKEDAGKGYLYQNNIIGTDMFSVSGDEGSVFLEKFWGMDMNLNYYVNYQYPTYSGTTTGATADRIVLNDGDIITIGHFSDMNFFGDPTSIFNLIVVNDDTVETVATMNQEITLNVYRAGADLGNGNGANSPVEKIMDVYYIKEDAVKNGDVTSWTKLGTTDEHGQLQVNVSQLNAGNYILAVAGHYGDVNTKVICSAPGGIVLRVLNEKDSNAVNEVIAKITAIGEVTLEDEAAIQETRKDYNALSEYQQKAVTNYYDLTSAEKELTKLQASNEDRIQAEAVDKLIDAIGAVTLEDEAAIQEARKAYEKLTATQKLLVKKLTVLLAAEKALEDLKVPEPVNADAEKVYKETGDYMENLGTPSVGAAGGDWMALGLARAERTVAKAYYANVVKFVQENIDENGRLDRNKSTETSRIILALTALGYDVTNVAGYNLLEGLNDTAYLKKQGINGPIWALIALDSHNYNLSGKGDVTRQKLIEIILEAQKADGGWALSGNSADADMTGMALSALAPYYKTDAKVKAAVDKALDTLSKMQHKDGSFGSIDGSCAESCAQVITALTALGINPDTDSRFIKNGISVVDALCGFAVEGGGFKHISILGRNGMATEQGYYALTAYMRFLEGKTALFDMSDVTIKVENDDDSKQENAEVGGTEDETGNSSVNPGRTETIPMGNTVLSGVVTAIGTTKKPEDKGLTQRIEAVKESLKQDTTVEELKNLLAEKNQTDSKTKISVSDCDWNIRLVVEEVTDTNEIAAKQQKLKEHAVLGLWDIHLEDAMNGGEVQPDGSVQMKIPTSLLGDFSKYDGLLVVHFTDDGKIEYLNCTIEEEFVVFNASAFSYYAVIGYMGVSPLDSLNADIANGDAVNENAPWLPWAMVGGCGIALLIVIQILVLKNKRAQAGK